MLKYLALLALLFASPAAAQDHIFPTPGNATVPGYVTMCIVANVAVPCNPGSITAGTTPVTCVSGTAGVLFQLAGVVSCDNGFTYAGAGGQVNATGGISSSTNFQVASGQPFRWSNGSQLLSTGSGVFILQSNGAGNTETMTLSGGVNGLLAFTGTIGATLATAVGTNAVCNTPATGAPLTVQVWATGCAASSARFKEGLASIDPVKALDDVMRFQPISYTYKPEFNMGSDRHVGFTAEQVGSVDPQWITYEDDGVTPHAVKYNEMAPLLAAAIQALKADNDNLRAEINALKASR